MSEHAIRFLIHGIRGSFVYGVSASEGRRILRYLRNREEGRYAKDFIVFDTADRRSVVAIRGSEIISMETFTRSISLLSRSPFPFHAKLYLRDRPAPRLILYDDATDAAWLMVALDSEPIGDDPPLFIDREEKILRASDIVLGEMDSALVNAGLRETR